MLALFGRLARRLEGRQRLVFLFILAVAAVNSLLELVLVAVTAIFGSALLAPQGFFGQAHVERLLAALGHPARGFADLVIGAGLLALVAVGVRAILGLAKAYLDARYIGWCYRTLAVGTFEVLLNRPYSWHLQRNSALLLKAVQEDLAQVQQLLVSSLQLGSDLLILAALMLAMLLKNGLWVVSTFVGLGLAARLVHWMVSSRLRRLADVHFELSKRSQAVVAQAFQGVKDIQVMGAEPAFEERFREIRTDSERLRATTEVYRALPRYSIEVLGFAGLILVAAGVTRSGLSQAAITSSLAVLGVAFIRVLPAANRILIHLALMTHSLPPAGNCLDLVESSEPELVRSAERGRQLDSLELQEVEFAYPEGDRTVLSGVSLQLSARQRIAVVGRSGEGKTTLVDLLCGLLPPTRGRVLANGEPLRQGLIYEYPQRVGYVLQEPFLLDASVAQNVALSYHDVDLPLVWDCLRRAQLEATIQALPQGVDTPIGERGARLSGGQAQRLAIARSLYRNPDLLILDEATSSLDSLTEEAFLQTLEALKGRHMMVIIAHRLATVARCDRILVVADGTISDQGSHQELLERSSVYRELVESQLGAVTRA